MKIFNYVIFSVSTLIALCSSVQTKANPLFSLENLERERAVFLHNLTNNSLSTEEREQQDIYIIKRLIDIERMVLRDDRIAMSNSVIAKNAFQQYNLTFLIHAASENKRSPVAHWLDALNITDVQVYKSQAGLR